MNYSIESFTLDFGHRVVEIQCPNCDDVYYADDSEVKNHLTDCWKCGALYLQKAHKTSNFKFVRKASFYCKGH